MKQLNILLLLSLFLISCGSSDRGVVGSNTTSVSLNLEQSMNSSSTLKSSSPGDIGALSIATPASVETIQVTVTDEASGEILVDTTVNVAGQSSVTLNLNVPNGNSRVFIVKAYCSDGGLLYQGSASADLNGSNVDLSITMYYYSYYAFDASYITRA